MIYVLHDCLTCRHVTDHYELEHGTHLELVCDVCQTSIDVKVLVKKSAGQAA